jgi:hypothetical protein
MFVPSVVVIRLIVYPLCDQSERIYYGCFINVFVAARFSRLPSGPRKALLRNDTTCNLEQQFQRELELPRIFARRPTGYRAKHISGISNRDNWVSIKIPCSRSTVRPAVINNIRNVEALGPELQLETLDQVKVLHQRQIQPSVGRSNHLIRPLTADRSYRLW